MSTIITNSTSNANEKRVDTSKLNRRNDNLKFVDNLDEWTVHHDDVDIRGFEVRSASGEVIGEIEGLLADVGERLVRYAEVEVNDDTIAGYSGDDYSTEDRHLLIPIGLIKINGDRSVSINGVNVDNFYNYPRYNRKNGYTYENEYRTNDYLYGFHDYGTKSRDSFYGSAYENSDKFDDNFYSSEFYTGRV